MQFTVSQHELVRSINSVKSFVSRKSTIDILSNILITVDDNVLYLSASNIDSEATAKLILSDDLGSSDGSTTVSSDKLHGIISNFSKDDKITFSLGKKLTVTSGNARFMMSVIDADQFPSMAINEGTLIKFKHAELYKLLSSVSFCASTDDPRYSICGVNISFDGSNINAVATDGHRMAHCYIEKDVAPFNPITLPNNTVLSVIKSLSINSDNDIDVVVTDNKIVFSFDNLTIKSLLVGHRYPDWRSVIPQASGSPVVFNAKELLMSIARVSAILDNSSKNSKGIKLTVENDIMLIETSQQLYEANDKLLCTYRGEKIIKGVNGLYATQVMSLLSDNCELYTKEGREPILIKDCNDKSIQFVIMPLAVN